PLCPLLPQPPPLPSLLIAGPLPHPPSPPLPLRFTGLAPCSSRSVIGPRSTAPHFAADSASLARRLTSYGPDLSPSGRELNALDRHPSSSGRDSTHFNCDLSR